MLVATSKICLFLRLNIAQVFNLCFFIYLAGTSYASLNLRQEGNRRIANSAEQKDDFFQFSGINSAKNTFFKDFIPQNWQKLRILEKSIIFAKNIFYDKTAN